MTSPPPTAPRGPHTVHHYLTDVPAAVVDGYVEETGIARLHAWQSRCLEDTALLAGGNVVVSVNTAGGKSLVAEVALLRAAFRGDGGVAVYVLPFLAMVSEKAAALAAALGHHNATAPRELRCPVVDCGDAGSAAGAASLGAPRALVLCTPEAALGLADRQALAALDAAETRPAKRRRAAATAALGNLRCVAVDELHMVGDAGRGAVYEKLLARLRFVAGEAGAPVQVVGLSATLSNGAAVAAWLGAAHAPASHRPVPLRTSLRRAASRAAARDAAAALAREAAAAGGQVLVFCRSVADAVATAEVLERALADLPRRPDRDAARAAAARRATDGDVRAALGRAGGRAAFHHGRLAPESREAVEAAYRAGAVSAVACTTTLSAGVNLPASRVVVLADGLGTPWRFPENAAVLAQILGRAGRGGRRGAATGDGVVVVHDAATLRDAARLLGDARSTAALPAVASRLRGAAVERFVLEAVVGAEAARARFDAASLARATARTLLHAAAATAADRAAAEEAAARAARDLVAHACARDDGGALKTTALGRAVVAAGGMIAPLEARLLGDALQRARRAHVGAHADLVVATVAAPLPGLDYHVHDALFLGESKIWAVLEALLDDFGAAPAFAALGVGNLRADLRSQDRLRVDGAGDVAAALEGGRWAGRRERLFVARRVWLALLADAVLAPDAPGAVAGRAAGSVADVAVAAGVPPAALRALVDRAPASASAAGRFARRLRWAGAADACEGRAARLRAAAARAAGAPTRWRKGLRSLRRVADGDVALARTLARAGLATARDVRDAGPGALAALLADAAPWAPAGGAPPRFDAALGARCLLAEALRRRKPAPGDRAARVAALARRLAENAAALAASGPERARGPRGARPPPDSDSDLDGDVRVGGFSDDGDSSGDESAAAGPGFEDAAPPPRPRRRPTDASRGSAASRGVDTYASSPSRATLAASPRARAERPAAAAAAALEGLAAAAAALDGGAFLGLALDLRPPPACANLERRRAWARVGAPRTGAVLVGAAVSADGGESAVYVAAAPVPPEWPWEEVLRRDAPTARARRSWAERGRRWWEPPGVLARVVHFAGFGRYAGRLGAAPASGAAGDAARLACRRWFALGRRGLVAAERAAGGRAALEAAVSAGAAAVAVDRAADAAAALRAAGAPLRRAVFDPGLARRLADDVAADGAGSDGSLSDLDGDAVDVDVGRREALERAASKAARDAAALRRRLARRGRAQTFFEGVEMAVAPALAEMAYAGVKVDDARLRRWAGDLKWFLRDCDAVAGELLGIDNLDAHGAVNRALGVARATAGRSSRDELLELARGGDGFVAARARLVLDYRLAAPCRARLKALEAALGPHPTLGAASDLCARPRVHCFGSKTGRCCYEAPNLQSFERGGVTILRMARPSARDVLDGGGAAAACLAPGAAVACLLATVSAAAPLGTLCYGALEAVLPDRCLADGLDGGGGRPLADYWLDEPARGFAWSYDGDAQRAICQVRVRVRGRNLTYPADRVYCLDAPPAWPGVPRRAAPLARETRDDRASPWDGAVTIEPRALVVARRGHVLLSADLAQNELRVAAQLSGDGALRRCFADDADDPFVDVARALRVAGATATSDRAAAKQVVYGVLYGQSTRSVARALGADMDAAAGAVGAVRRLFPRLERYRATVAADAARDGFVETLLGKRRALPRITDADRKRRSRAERQALSTAVQGSAADLVKRAMAETVAAFADRPPATKPHLVIQLHDELIFETPEAAAASNAALVATALEAGLDDVPTRVKLKVGPTWADLEDL